MPELLCPAGNPETVFCPALSELDAPRVRLDFYRSNSSWLSFPLHLPNLVTKMPVATTQLFAFFLVSESEKLFLTLSDAVEAKNAQRGS